MRRALILLSLVALTASIMPSAALAAPGQEKYRIYVFTAGTPPAAAQAAVQAIRNLGMARGFGVQANGDPASFTDENLTRFRAVVFLTGPGDRLNAAQEAAFEAYFRAGGGFVGIGAAVETDPDWAFLTEIIGARASGRTGSQSGTIKVADRLHDASRTLPEYWERTEAWYNFTANVRGQSHVLATVVEDPFGPQPSGLTLDAIAGGTMGADHPVAWCKDWKGGRSFYTALGGANSFGNAQYRSHVLGAIEWAAGVADPVTSDCGATVLANYQQTKVSAPPNLSEPIGFDVLPDSRVIQTDRRGGVRLHDPAINQTFVLATVPVYTNSEDGMYGPAIDNDFATNHWVYLFYAPPTVEVELSDGSTVTQTTVQVNDPTTPQNESVAPTVASSLAAWDPWIGYFQLSRFKFVDGPTPTLDLASEQEILRVPVNRGACCHVAGDIDFDQHNNLWLVTGDDTPAGGGNSGGFGPFNGQLTDERQLLTATGATGGTFTLTFDGQTTGPIPFPFDNLAIESALEGLSNLTDVGVTGNAASNRTIIFGGSVSAQDVPNLVVDPTGLIGTAPSIAVTTPTINNGQNVQIPAVAGMYNAPHVDARRSALNTNDLRGKILRFTVKAGDIGDAEENAVGGAYTVPSGNLFAPGTTGTRSEIYAMGFRNPFRIQVDENDVAYITDYSPDSNTPTQFRGPAGTGRVEIVRQPANYGWPVCYRTDLPYYQWDFETSAPLPSAASPETYDCDNPSQGPRNDSRWNLEGGPTVEPGLEFGPPITNPEVWYSFTPENQATNPRGTPCFAYYGPDAQNTPNCPRLFPEFLTGGVGPHGSAKYHYDPDNPDPTKFPPYYDNAIFFGEFTRDFLREIRLDSQNRVFKVSDLLSCGAVSGNPTPARPFECDNPMDMQFDESGHFYLLTYGDGFFAINNDAGMYRWDYVKGQRAPNVVLGATPTDGPAPLTVQFSSEGSVDPDPADSIRFEWDFDGNGTVDSMDPNPVFVYTTTGVFTSKLTVIDSSGKSASGNTTITVGNTSPSITVNVPVEGGTFTFGDNIPFTVTVTDPEDGAIDCTKVEVTFVLGHDTHGHAETTTTGCSGLLPTDVIGASHGGNVFGVISASYTDTGGAGGVPPLTTVDQNQIRQKRQKVEFVLNQSGTNTAPSTDVGGGLQRGSLSAGDWMELNGPFNLLNINSITFRVTGGNNGAASGTVELWRDAINASGGGTLVASQTITGTAAGTYASQTFPLVDPGGTHRLFLVFANANTYSLNWVEFGGAGVGVGVTPP